MVEFIAGQSLFFCKIILTSTNQSGGYFIMPNDY